MLHASRIQTIPVDSQITKIDERWLTEGLTEKLEPYICHMAARQIHTLNIPTVQWLEWLAEKTNSTRKQEIVYPSSTGRNHGKVLLIHLHLRCRSRWRSSPKLPEERQIAIALQPATLIALLLSRRTWSFPHRPVCNARTRSWTFRSVIRLSIPWCISHIGRNSHIANPTRSTPSSCWLQ